MTTPAELLIQDSWLVDSGRVRALDSHLGRFTAAVRAMPGARSPEKADLGALLDAVPGLLPMTGRWFPRVFCRWDDPADSPELGFELRPAPEVSAVGPVLAALSPGDPRTHPRLKGPDLAMLGRLRDDVRRQGADEAVLLDRDGFVLEGAWSSLVWWSAPDRLGVPAGAVLRSITRELLEDSCRARGITIEAESLTPRALQEREVWCLSALRGIRRVEGWLGADAAQSPPLPGLALAEARIALTTIAKGVDDRGPR